MAICGICHRKFFNEEALEKHMEEDHGEAVKDLYEKMMNPHKIKKGENKMKKRITLNLDPDVYEKLSKYKNRSSFVENCLKIHFNSEKEMNEEMIEDWT